MCYGEKSRMTSKIILTVIYFIFNFLQISEQSICTISTNKDIAETQPLILRPEGGYGNDAFYLPNDKDTIILPENQLVELACPRGELLLNGNKTDSKTGQAICYYGNFSINGRVLPFNAITCSAIPYSTARYTGNTCLSKYQEIEIGFLIGVRFLRLILVCFDNNTQNTLYTEFNLTKAIAGFQVGYPRPSWLAENFYNLGNDSLDVLYTRNAQRTTINSLLGLNTTSFKYVAESSDFYLARGHLAAEADFVYGSQQRLTFYFVNAAPQWQTFNGGNWNSLESDIRDFASRARLDFVVYTGTYDVATLPHETTGQDIGLYLHTLETTRSIPVPRIFWKVLYEPKRKAGVAFLGVNNPYVFNKTKDVICKDVCGRYKWLTWKASNVTLGYSYCCTVDEFRKIVTTLPSFEVVDDKFSSGDNLKFKWTYLLYIIVFHNISYLYR